MNAKRPAEETIPTQRRTRIKLASPSPERTTESDTESIHSYQGYKTELATDTSDTSSPPPPPPPAPPPEANQAEYEIAEPEEQHPNFYLSDDSEHESSQKEVFTPNSDESLDNALLGDMSEENSTSPTSNSDVDPGLPRNDYLDFERCLLCQTEKKDISYPYCSPCFTWRKNFFPSRPKKRLKDLKKNSFKGNGVSDALFKDSGIGSTETPLSEDTVDGPSQPSTSSSTSTLDLFSIGESKNPEPCRVCFLKPENGLFVHSKISHRYGCYSCAKKIWYSSRVCPLCRRKVFKVQQMFT